MKNSKFWIWFIPMFLIICTGIFILLIWNKDNIDNNDAKKQGTNDAETIKYEYELLNNDKNMVVVNLSKNNSYKSINDGEIKNIFDGNDAIIYLGNVSDNVARKTISILDEAIAQTSIENVYYIELSDKDNSSSDSLFINNLSDKSDVKNINPGTLITIQKGDVLNVYVPNVKDNLEVTKEEHDYLLKEYQKQIKIFIEACDENC